MSTAFPPPVTSPPRSAGTTVHANSRLSGVTPAAISLLLIHLRKGRFKGFAANELADDAAA